MVGENVCHRQLWLSRAIALTQSRDTGEIDTVITVDPGAQGRETTESPCVRVGEVEETHVNGGDVERQRSA